jgi:hypothetical protein
MRIGRAISAGVIGYVIVVAAVAIAGRLSGSNADLCTLFGAVLTGRDDVAATVAGCATQLVVAVVAALVYAGVFEWVTRRAGILIGLAIGVGHVTIAGLAVGFLPAGRLIAAGMLPPGAFLEYRGAWVIATFVLAHLVFGAIVGGWYGETLHRFPNARVEWSDVRNPESAVERNA